MTCFWSAVETSPGRYRDGRAQLRLAGRSEPNCPGQTSPGLVAFDEAPGGVPGSRQVSYADTPALLSADGRTGVVAVYPKPVPGADAYASALPALQSVAATATRTGGAHVVTTGEDALATGDGGGSSVLIETLFGGIGALVVLVLVFGSFLAVMPLLVAAVSILTTFLIVWGLTGITDVSFIVQYLLSLIGLGVAIDYALLIVTRWREEQGAGARNSRAVERALATAGRSVLFSGITVAAVSLAALIALPVPFLRSVGFTGPLIPIMSVLAALTLLPALLLTAGPRLAWPNSRTSNPESRLRRRVGGWVVGHTAVYGNAWWIALIIIAVTFFLLARALRSIVLPIKALVLNVISVAAACGVTVLIWQHGLGTKRLFGQTASGSITLWVPIAVFAFLFGLSMGYEVFLLSRIREEHDSGHDTDESTRYGFARTGRLVTSAALILFLAFIALSRVPDTDVKILATALALGIIIDATIVRGILAPALVPALVDADWWLPGRRGGRRTHEESPVTTDEALVRT